jgi:hypothetical protein
MAAAAAWMVPAFAVAAPDPEPEDDAQVEQRVLKKLGRIATRKGDVLVLKLDSGRKARFESIDGCAGGADYCLTYRLLGLSPDRRFFEVGILEYESTTRYWVARSNGKKYELHAQPHVSPGGTYAVVANPAECCSLGGVFLWEVNRGRLIEKFHHESTEYALYSFARWTGPHAAELKKVVHADKAFCPSAQIMETTATLVRAKGKWKLNERIDPSKVICKQEVQA